MNNTIPFVSVVIATYNRPAFVSKCVSALLLNSYNHYEIIVVDQSRDNKTREIVEHIACENIKYLHSDVIGLSHARNLGCRMAKGSIIAFIDDDAVAAPDWIDAYVETFTQISPSPAMAGGKIVPYWEIPRPLWYPQEREYLLGIYDRGSEMKPFPQTDLPIGANFAVLKSAIEALGGFDSRVGFDNSRKNSMIAGEDSLLGIKVRDAGLSIYYQPRASVFHHISAHKLTRSYFLKRHYWEGATQVVIKSCKQQIDHHMWIKILFWHLSKMLKVFIKIIIGLLKGDPSTTRMLQLSKLAYSFGVSVQTLKIGRSKVKCG